MKKTYKQITILILLLGLVFNVKGQSVSLPSAKMLSAPMDVIENEGVGFAGFDFTESSGVSVPARILDTPNVSIRVNLQYIEIADFTTSLVSGSLLDYFEVSYDSTLNILLFEQNDVIPADWFGSVNFPVKVTQNSTKEQSFNGFNVNITAIDLNTNADGNASVFTYTSRNVAATNELSFENLTVYPIPTGNVLHIDNTKISLLYLSIFDNRGRLVLEEKVEGAENSINVKNLASGSYYLKIYDTAQKAYDNIKFIVK